LYDGPNAARNAIGYATHYSRSHYVVIRFDDAARDVIETHEHRATSNSGERCGANKKPPCGEARRVIARLIETRAQRCGYNYKLVAQFPL
jgi:hypothetical protein